MSRIAAVLVGPEAVMIVITAAVFAVCAKHNSGQGRDVDLMEQMLYLVPLIAVTAVFLTVFAPGAKTWWWLGRAVAASFIGSAIFSYRIIIGFGEGAKGQDAGFIIGFLITGIIASIGTAASGAMIYAHQNPAFAEWFRMRPVIGTALTALAAVPIGFGLMFGATTVLGTALGLLSLFKR